MSLTEHRGRNVDLRLETGRFGVVAQESEGELSRSLRTVE